MGARLTKEQFVNKAISLHGNRFTYDKLNYINSDAEIIVTCVEHGDFKTTGRNHLRGKGGCIACSGGVSLNTEIFINRSKEIHGDKYNYSLAEYINHGTKLKIICKEHGVFEQVAEYHMNGQGCPKCAGRVIHTKEDFIKALPDKQLKYNYSYDKIPEVFKPQTILTVTCQVHGDFTTNYDRFIRRQNSCRVCSGYAKSNTDSFVVKANQIHDYFYTYSNVNYNTWEDHVLVTCPNHGDFKVTPNNHLNGKGCPKCVHQVSSHEDKLFSEFPELSRTNRNIIHPYHLDLYCDANNLAIEINGRYWHSESNGKDKNYHLNKTNLCLDKNITLLHFWDNEIDSKFDIVRSMIAARLNKVKRIYARKCEVVKITVKDTRSFLDTNHLQGYANSSENYGLSYGGELVSVMTFNKPRFTKNAEWEIIRFANKLNMTLVGGASRLFKMFLKDKKPNSIITYADRRYSEGNLYKELGFKFSHDSRPNYFYSKGSIDIPRYKAQKHKLLSLLGDKFCENKSETENMLDNGFVKVYDCGNKVFMWNNPTKEQ